MPKKKSKSKEIFGKLLLLVLLVLLGGLVVIFLFHRIKEETLIGGYYPKSSFKIPEDVLRERLATISAQTVRIPIIMYHYVEYVDRAKDPGRANLATSPYYLDAQISSLKKAGYHFLFVREIAPMLNGALETPSSPVALTFDDGYEDFYSQALPILKKYQVKATIYVMSNYLNQSGYLTSWEIKELIASGLVEIGSHTLDHMNLSGVAEKTATKEIMDDKARLEKEFGITILSFAYPYGGFTKDTIALAKKAGFTSAVSVVPGVDQSIDNLFYLYRLRPGFLPLPDPAKSLKAYRSHS